MTEAILDGLRVSIMVASAAGAVIASLLAVGVLYAFGWYVRSTWRGE